MTLTTTNEAFTAWLHKVDAVLVGACGLGVDDLADAPYADYFADEMIPHGAAAYVLSEWNDMDEGLLEELGLADYL